MAARSRHRSRASRWLARVGIGVGVLIVASVALVLPLRWIDPPTTAVMLADDSGRVPVRYEWAGWGATGLAPTLAVVAAEDQKFAEHFGFDVDSIRDSIEDFTDGEPLRGASTITQQVAKNLYLWQGRSFVRKGLEAWFTVLLEVSLPKRRILEIYLNVVELGPGIYGFPAASRYFFGKEPSRITDAEAALLAAVLPNPARLQADRPSRYVRERQRWILGQMGRLRREQWALNLR
ncbi:MAG: monofunctional biosynthetic peptidoglycan transglycosylase [Gammaproteobacteria bacterium]|nr:monofunctional biosynthetic peptidoglycan transglycosylase [Gammaproteobacteria bacterium]